MVEQFANNGRRTETLTLDGVEEANLAAADTDVEGSFDERLAAFAETYPGGQGVPPEEYDNLVHLVAEGAMRKGAAQGMDHLAMSAVELAVVAARAAETPGNRPFSMAQVQLHRLSVGETAWLEQAYLEQVSPSRMSPSDRQIFMEYTLGRELRQRWRVPASANEARELVMRTIQQHGRYTPAASDALEDAFVQLAAGGQLDRLSRDIEQADVQYRAIATLNNVDVALLPSGYFKQMFPYLSNAERDQLKTQIEAGKRVMHAERAKRADRAPVRTPPPRHDPPPTNHGNSSRAGTDETGPRRGRRFRVLAGAVGAAAAAVIGVGAGIVVPSLAHSTTANAAPNVASSRPTPAHSAVDHTDAKPSRAPGPMKNRVASNLRSPSSLATVALTSPDMTVWQALSNYGVPDSQIMPKLQEALAASGQPFKETNPGTIDEVVYVKVANGGWTDSTEAILEDIAPSFTT